MTYRLGSIDVDPANFLLTENGETISVEPLVFDLIVFLIENRDRLLTREEILDKIWAGKVVSDTSLSNHIKSARKALGDDGQRQQFIKTIHGRGYRFVAEIEEVGGQDIAEKNATTVHPRSDRQTSGSARKRLVIYTASVLLLITIGVTIGSRILFFGPDEVIKSIAVLPLQNLSNDPAQKYFVEGMQDALITRLSRATELRVISKTSTLRYETTDKSIPEIARELNVDALIEGSVFRDANRVLITAKLIRGASDEHLWANSYDRGLEHALTLINEISMAIADEIEVAVKQQDMEEWTQSTSVDFEVHELVLRGRHYFDRFMFDQSLRYYQEAVDLDADFAPAHAGVAASYLLKGFFGSMPNSDYIPKAREAALKAISLDSSSAGGYSSLGFIQLYFDWDWELARKNLLRALELSPNDARARHAYADYLMVMGDLKESLNQVEIGHLYDPFSPMAGSVVNFHRLLVRRYDEVIEEGRKAIARDPDLVVNYSYYQEALWLNGMYEEAFAAYKRTWGRDEELLRAMNNGFSESGYTGAIHSLANALAGHDPEFNDYVTLAKLYVRASEPALALESLEKAYQHRQPQLLHIKAMPVFDELRSNPEFQDLLHRIGFPEAARR